MLAEGEGFEPPLRFPVKRFSRPPVSTTHTSLRTLVGWASYTPPSSADTELIPQDRPSIRSAVSPRTSVPDPVHPNIRPEGFWNHDRAVLLLAVLEDRDERAPDRKA